MQEVVHARQKYSLNSGKMQAQVYISVTHKSNIVNLHFVFSIILHRLLYCEEKNVAEHLFIISVIEINCLICKLLQCFKVIDTWELFGSLKWRVGVFLRCCF